MPALIDLEKIKNYELEDDGTPYGGTSFAGETVGDFIDSICDVLTDSVVDLEVLNGVLMQSGIKPICI